MKHSQSKRKLSEQKTFESFKKLKNIPEICDPAVCRYIREQIKERPKSPCIPALQTSDSGHKQALSLLRDLYVATKPLHEAMRSGVPPEETLDAIRELTYKEKVASNASSITKEKSDLEAQRSLSIDRKAEYTNTKSKEINVEGNRRKQSISGKLNTSEKSDSKRPNNKSYKLKPIESIPNIYVMAHSQTDIQATLPSSSNIDQFVNTQVSTEKTWTCPATQTSTSSASPKTKQNAEMRTVYLQR